MPKIRKLSAHEAQKIAAGEVVERPANIVKELVENSLDANATQIILYLEHAGKKSIRVTDNGCGMNSEDAYLCFEHHATSKIQQINDLQTITTFGFRGEALSSIASVSTVVLTTKQAESNEGLQLILKNGTVIKERTVPAVTGTDITIERLFDAIPVRKKFLKTKDAEWRHIQQLFFAIALDYTEVSFKLYSEKKLLFNCPSTNSVKKRWAQLSDQETEANLLPLESLHSQENLKISGVISNHQYGRYDRSGIYFFVNNRWIKDYKLNRAFIDGYQNVLPTNQYPIGCIKIDIEPTQIDVNVHPRKEEVQFLNAYQIYNLIKKTVSHTLECHASKTFATQATKPILHAESYSKQEINNEYSNNSSINPKNFAPFNFETFFDAPLKNNQIKKPQSQDNFALQKNDNIQSDETPAQSFRIIGIYNKTYILLEKENGLVFIDQHAAHERILYEQFKKKEKPAPTQLIFPQTIILSKNDIRTLSPYLPLLCSAGIETEVFSNTQIIIKATPIQLKNIPLQEVISNCITLLYQEKNDTLESLQNSFNKTLYADMACKAAVKAGDQIAQEQIYQLINDLDKIDNRFSCPHGRPTSWNLLHETIKKRFKRDYR